MYIQENQQVMEKFQINELIDTWQNNFRKKVVSAKEKAKNKELFYSMNIYPSQIAKALDQLISHFDDVNLQLIKSNINATFTEDEYPHEDAELTANECNPLPIDWVLRQLYYTFFIKIVLSRGDLVVEKSEDTHSKEISIEDKEKESDSNEKENIQCMKNCTRWLSREIQSSGIALIKRTKSLNYN
uniref:Protein CUSTOS n=1 Tax=Heterorhabditis bacteriophora TaxID=37862 RepID=A0A1I7W6S9_HETBA